MPASDPPVYRRNPLPWILAAGFVAGTLDITAACTQYYIKTGKGPAGVLRYVASGIFGRPALSGGDAMAAWGLLFHYLIAFLFTIFFFLVYPRIPLLSKNKVVTGLVYGLVVWAVMNLVVVPISAVPQGPFKLKNAAIAATILMFCIGLPISLIIGKYYSKDRQVS